MQYNYNREPEVYFDIKHNDTIVIVIPSWRVSHTTALSSTMLTPEVQLITIKYITHILKTYHNFYIILLSFYTVNIKSFYESEVTLITPFLLRSQDDPYQKWRLTETFCLRSYDGLTWSMCSMNTQRGNSIRCVLKIITRTLDWYNLCCVWLSSYDATNQRLRKCPEWPTVIMVAAAVN